MIIVSAADEKFAPHFATMLHSAWMHNPDAEFYRSICSTVVSNHETRARLKLFAKQIEVRLAVIPVEMERFADLPTTEPWSAAVYGRLWIPDLFPNDVKALHLDADCIVVAFCRQAWSSC